MRYTFATDITAQEIVVFRSDEDRWAEVNVIEAVCASAALPFAFKPRAIIIPSAQDIQKREEHFFIDGGLLRNRPVEYFDEMSFQNPHMDASWRFQQRTNRQTLGLCLEEGEESTPESLLSAVQSLKQDVEKIGLADLVWRIGKIFYNAEALIQLMRHDIADRCICIYVKDLGTANFEIVEDEVYLKIIKNWGQAAAEKFFSPSFNSNNINLNSPEEKTASNVNQVRSFMPAPFSKAPISSSAENNKVAEGIAISTVNNQSFMREVQAENQLILALQRRYKANASIKSLLYNNGYDIDHSFINPAIVEEYEKEQKEQELLSIDYLRSDRLHSFEGIYQAKQLISLTSIFETAPNEPAVHRILIEGSAGIGKSILCKYIANQWASGKLNIWKEQFTVIIWLPLRCLHSYNGEKTDLKNIIYDQCLAEEQKHEFTVETLAEQLEHLEREGQVLYLLDGYDEVAGLINEKSTIDKILHLLLSKTYWILTSRPYYTKSFVVKFDRCLKIIGFTNENIYQYVEQFFQNFDEKTKSDVLLSVLKSNPELSAICHFPTILELICNIYQQDKLLLDEQAINSTRIYKKLIMHLQRRFLEKQNIETQFLSSSDIETHPDIQIIIYFLDELAWEAMKQKTMILNSKQIQSLISKTQDSPNKYQSIIKGLKEFGLLKPMDAHKTSWLEQDYYFIHLTFQEYFAALYFIRFFNTNELSSEIQTLISQSKDNSRYKMVWHFVIELSSDLTSWEQSAILLTLLRMLENHNDSNDVRVEAIKALSQLGQTHLELKVIFLELMRILENHNNSSDIRIEAIKALGQLGQTHSEVKAILPELMRILDNHNNSSGVRIEAIKALGQLGQTHSEVKVILMELMGTLKNHNNSSDVRIEAIKALSQVGQTHVELILPKLMEMLNDRGSDDVQAEIIKALGQLGHLSKFYSEVILSELITMLDSRNQCLRMEAIKAMSQFGQTGLKTMQILESINPESEHVQNISTQLETFFDYIKDPVWKKRVQVIWMLRELSDSEIKNEKISQILINLIRNDSVYLVKGIAAYISIVKLDHDSQTIISNLQHHLKNDLNEKLQESILQREIEIILHLIQSKIDMIVLIGLTYLSHRPIADLVLISKCQEIQDKIENRLIKNIALQAYQVCINKQKEQYQSQIELDRQIYGQKTDEVKNRYSAVYKYIQETYEDYISFAPIFAEHDIKIKFDILKFNLALIENIANIDNINVNQKILGNIEELFYIRASQCSEKILIAGDAGVGKSTLCQFISYQWSKGALWADRFDWVFVIPMRHLTVQKYTNNKDSYQLADLIKQEYFSSKQSENVLKEKDIDVDEFIQTLLTQSSNRCLFMIDGYNETQGETTHTPDYLQAVVDQLIIDGRYSVLITTRPHFLGDKRFDRSYELQYLSYTQIDDYISEFFSRHIEKVESLKSVIEANNSLYTMIRLPLNLMLLCSSWQLYYEDLKNNLDTLSLFELYECFIKGCMQDKNIFTSIAQCAFNCLTQSRLIFVQEDLGSTINIEVISRIPFIKTIDIVTTEQKTTYMFVYHGLQEFLAAKYLLEQPNYQKFIQANKYDVRYQNMLAWIAGWLRKDTLKLTQYFGLLLGQPNDIYGYYECLLLIKCVDRCGVQSLQKTQLSLEVGKKIIYQIEMAIRHSLANNDVTSCELLWEAIKQSTEVLNIEEVCNTIKQMRDHENVLLTSLANEILENTLPKKLDELNLVSDSKMIEQTDPSFIPEVINSQKLVDEVVKDEPVYYAASNNFDTTLSKKELFGDFGQVKEYLIENLTVSAVEQFMEEDFSQLLSSLKEFRKEKIVTQQKSNSEFLIINKNLVDLLAELSNKQTLNQADISKKSDLIVECIYTVNYLDKLNKKKLKNSIVETFKKLLEVEENTTAQLKTVSAIIGALVHISQISLLSFLPYIQKIIELRSSYIENLQIKTSVFKQLRELEPNEECKKEILNVTQQFIKDNLHKLNQDPDYLNADYIWENLYYAVLLFSKWKEITADTIEFIMILIRYISTDGTAVDNDSYSLAIKYIANTNLAPFLSSLDNRTQQILLEKAQFLLKATTIQALLNETVRLKSYKLHFPFIIKIIELKKIAIIEDKTEKNKSVLKFYEEQKLYEYNTDKFTVFFLKLRYAIGGLAKEYSASDKITWRIDRLNDEFQQQIQKNQFLDKVIAMKEDELVFAREILKAKLKNIPNNKKQFIFSFFAQKKSPFFKKIIEDVFSADPEFINFNNRCL